MLDAGFADYLKRKGANEETVQKAMSHAEDLERYLASHDLDISHLSRDALDQHLKYLITANENTPERLVATARYLAYRDRPDLFIHLATILNSYEILPLMEERVLELMGEDKREAIFHGFKMPPLGTPPEAFPSLTRRLVERMEGELTPEQCKSVLTYNYHGIPREAYEAKRKRYLESNSLDEFLAAEHQALVEELTECLRTGKVWYEQEVSQEFVDHVAADQSLQTGIRDGDRIIMRKVPFDPKRYYAEKRPFMKRYYYCHCPLARSAIKEGGRTVSPTLCHCSAGFTKLPWDVIFDEGVEVEVLETVLGGGDGCVFSVRIPPDKMK